MRKRERKNVGLTHYAQGWWRSSNCMENVEMIVINMIEQYNMPMLMDLNFVVFSSKSNISYDLIP